MDKIRQEKWGLYEKDSGRRINTKVYDTQDAALSDRTTLVESQNKDKATASNIIAKQILTEG